MKPSITHDKPIIIDRVLTRIDPSFKDQTETYIEKSRADIGYTIDFTLESIRVNEPLILLNYYAWLITTLDAYNIKQPILLSMFDALKDELKDYLYTNENAFLASITQEDILKHLKDHTRFAKPVQPIAKPYLDALLKKDRLEAKRYIDALINQGTAIESIYLDVIQPAMIEVGALWQRRKITVADEHMATVITQYVMTQLYPYIFATEKNGKTMVGLALGSELHEIGIRMVCDLFENSGYSTHYLGANMPAKDLVAYLKSESIDLVAVSVTISTHLSTLNALIKAIKSDSELTDVKILIGGQAIMSFQDPVSHFQADGFALDAKSAVKEGDRLVDLERSHP